MQAASVGAHAPRAPPTDREKKLMDVLLDAADARVAPLLACVKGWPLEAQADLANWRAVLLKLHRLLLAALQQCPRLLLVETELEKTQQPIAVQTEQELAELVFEILKFSAFLLENAANKAVYPSAEPVMALLAARNERVVAEATKVVAMLALPPQVHRYAADPTSFVDPAASRNSLLRRRLLVVAQGRGTPKNSLEVVDYLNTTSPDAARDEDFQFYSSEQEGDEDAAARVVNVAIPPYEEIVGASTTPAEAACAAATACERLIQQYNIPKRLHFRLFTQVHACYAARSPLARENLVVERLYALLALFSLFSDAWDVTNYVEQHPELTRGVVELIRVESIERVPVRVRVTALLVLTALVNDRVGRAGGMGVLGRQSNVLQALGVVKGTPHGVFPSLVRFCMAELGDVSALSSTATTSGSPLPTALASETADTDMDMSLAVAFVQATTDLLSPQEAEVVSAPPFRSVSSGNVQEAKLCWMEAVLGLLTTVVAIQSGAAVLTENGIVPALLHVLTIPSVSTFHMAVTTQCVQALEITVSSHSAAAALYRDLNGVGILVDRLKLESASIVGGKRTPTSSANSETKTVLLLAILASLSMSFHSQGVMSAGATSRAIREGSALNKVLLQLLSNVDVFGPVVFAQAAVVVSDVINNDPSSVNHVHAAGLADAFLKTLTRWDIAELYPSRILLPPSSELLTAVPTVLNALCLTTTHAEKVAKYEPLMHLLDVFALPQYTEDEAKDYCFQGDTAAAVGAGIFELMRHVPSFQNAAIQAAVHALKKVIRFGEESKQTLTSSAQHVSEDKDHNILIRMTTHVADLLEPLLSKSEHAAYFADLGGIRLLLALYQLILPSTSSFLDGALPSKKATRAGSPQSSLAHNPAVHSITLALRSYASQQPTNLLAAIVKELSSQMDSLQRARANVGLPWYLSESGEGAEGVLSSLRDIDLAKLITAEDNSSVANTSADKVMVAGEYLRVLAVLEWLASVLIWTLETAHTHMQSRRWFTDFTTPSTQHVMARLFRVDRSVQFERASLAALHQKKRKEKSKESKEMKVAGDEADTSMELTSGTGEDKTNSVEAELSKSSRGAGLWKMGSLLLLRFSLSMRGLLTAYGKVFLSAPMQHRRGDDIVVPLAPHARKLARTVTQILEGHLLYVVSVNRATQIDTFVQQYYLTFLLETISVVLFEGKKKQANTLLLVELMKPLCDISEMQTQTKPPQSPRVAPASIEDVPMIQEGEGDAAKSGKTIATCAGAQITASNLMDVVMNIIERFFAVCVEGEREQSSNSGADDVVKPSQMALTSFHIAASVLRKLANLEGLSASPLTAALLTSDEAGESDEAPFEPRKLTAQLHGMCVRALLSVWRHPKFAYSPVDSCLAEVMPIAVTILKNRMDNDDEAAGSDGEGELSGSGRRQGLGFSRGNRERNSSTELYNEALSLRRALFGGTRGTGSSGSSRHQSFVPDTEIVDSLVSMGFQQSRVERALRQIQVNNVELAMEWILGHPEDEGEDDQHDEADDEDVAAGDAALRREKEAADEKKLEEDLQALYISLRDSFESVCFQILRVQADKKRQDAAKRQAPDVAQAEASSNFYPSQNLVKAIAEYFSFLCSRSDEDRDLVIQRLNAAVLDYFHEDEEGGDEYLTMMAHLLALVLQLNSDAWTVMQLQSPSCIDKLVAFVSSAGTNKDGSLKPSCTPILLVLDAAVAGKATKRLSTSPSSTVDDALVGSEAKINNEPNEGSRQSMNQGEDSAFEQQLVSICLQILKQASLAVPPALSTMADNKTLAHAIWQLLSRLTLKYDLASYFSAHGGLDAILDIPEGLFFVGYQELTSTLLSQALESPEVLEHMMEDKIRRAITKLSTRFGAPSQMRITPRALLTEVAPFAARNEAVFLRALQNSVRVKKTESGRTYILPIPKKSDGSDAPPPGQPVDQPNVSLESGTSGAKTPHKLPKDHKHHAHVIVYKIIGRIRKLWGEEKSVKKQHEAHQTPGNETGLVSAGLCVGVYLQLLVHLITYFPACATVLAKAKDEAGAHGEEDEEDENDDDDDDDDDDEDDDDDDDDDDDEDEDEDEFEEHQHLHMSRRTGGHGSSRRTSSNRLWGSLDSELSILDALDEVDEEEFSYLNMLDDEAFLAEEQRRRARLAAARNARPGNGTSDVGQQAGSSEDRLVESMRDALGLYNDGGGVSTSYSTGQTLVLTFGDIEDEEVEGENQAEVATTRGRVGSGGGFGNSLGSQSRYGGGAGSVVSSSLLQYIEELPDMLDDDFLFESFDAGGRGDRSRRDRQLGRSGGIDQFTPNATTHPLLRTSGRGDASLLDSNGLVRNPGRLTLPRHSTLLRELQELTDQVQTQLPLGGSRSRLAIGRDLLQRGGGGSRGRPPSRINRLSAVSNLLSEFSLDIPNSLPSRHQRLSLRRGDRDIFGDVFVGVDLSRGLGSRAGDVIGGSASNSTMWGSSSGGRAVDIRSVASRLEQQITRICADNDEPPVSAGRRDREASSQRREDVDDIMEESSAVGTPRSGEHTASDPRAVDDAVESDAQPDASENSDRMERHDAATDAASVLELTSTLGESSLLRSPPESDVDVDIVEAEAETPSERQEASPAAASNPAATSILDSALPPPAPISLPAEASSTTASATSNSMMNFTLDLSGFGATSTQSTTASDATNQARAVEEESKTEELPPTETQAVSVEAAAAQELSVESFDQQEGQQVYQCPEGMDAEVFASLPPDMQAEIVAQNAPAVAESTSARSDTATAGGGGGSESMSQLDLDMANSSFDRETLEALPPDIRAEVLENERREREAAARAETADTSRAQEMDNASFVASLAPELREEILVTCDDAFLQTLPSQVRAEAMVLRERAAFRSTYRERDRGTEGRGGGEGDMDELFNRPTLRRMLTSQPPETGSGRRRSRMYDELGGGRRSSRREYRQGAGSTKAHQGLLRVEKDEEEDARERIFDDRCVRGLLRLLFMTQSVIQNRVFQRLLANICLYPLTRCSVRRNLLRVISLPLAKPLVPGDERDDDDDGSGKIQFPPSSMYGCGIDGNRSIGGSAVPTEVVNRMLHVLVSLAKYNPRFTVEMLQPHGMRRQISVKSDSVKMDPSSGECGVAVLIDLLALPVVYRNGTNLDALLELLELVLSPLERLHKPRTDDEEKKEGEEGEAATPEPGDEWVAVPAVELDEVRMGEIVAVLAMDLCTNQMQERTLAVLKLLNHVPGNRELVIRAVVRHASKLARVERYKGDNASAETTGYESSAVLPSAQDELKLLRLLHSLSDVCESTAEFTECCQTIGLDPLWDALSVSLTEARAKGGLDDQDIGAPGASATQASSTVGSESQVAAASDDAEGTVIEGKSAGASCAMAALLARFLPMVEAFFVVNARDAASMSLRVPDSSEREEAVVAALRVGGFDGADATALMGTDEQKASPKSVLKRSSSVLSSVSIEAGETIRLANFVESNRVLLNLLVREKPSLLDTSLAALIKISRCRAYLAFDNKRTYFHSAMKRLRQTALRNHGGGSSSVRIPVRREHIFEDSYYALRMRSGTELRRKLHISFTGEEGIDAGGVTREWYMILAREMFNPNYVLFTSAADSPTFQPNPLSYVNKDHLSYFEFVGKVLGKAVADGQLLDAHFTRSFYKHILQLPISYHDMEAIDPEYYRNLHSILDNSIADLGLELTFSAEQSNFGKFEVVDLIPNGRNVVVTDENKMEYVKLVTHHRMATGIRQQIDSFLKGFHQLVPPEMIAIFNENELELLISGMPEIDIDDLKANTEYANYKPTDSVIRWFWNVLYSFTHEERALFLQFVTGTSKVPLEGFKALEGMRGTQKFNIHKAFGNNSALPSAHTCFNQLDLPEYESEEKLKQCLLLAIREGSEGFGFG
ncbi:E3 ubiquitin-protein ligase [Phytophthora fragariae]|uniref:HECT-type E3 ubiquitin transferase n=1 Tax=Phytophthora fragariae TaxID=53985 RepID=A0A6G0PBT5_9STRA|nr:E3 ubiquitin-protein ligase [Phytophthora fragariae]